MKKSNNKGMVTFESLFVIVTICLFIAFFISMIPVFIVKFNLMNAGRACVRVVEQHGVYDNDVENELRRIIQVAFNDNESFGKNVKIKVSTLDNVEKTKFELHENVKLKLDVDFYISNVFTLNTKMVKIPISSTSMGRCENYVKEN